MWQMLDANGKRGLTVGVAMVCDERKSGNYITMIDAQSGRKLAEARGSTFTVF